MIATYGPYEPVRRAGNLLFVSGQIGLLPETKTAPKDIAGQTERAILNLENILQKAGVDLNDVIKTTIYLTDMSNFEAMNKVYELRFSTPRPARATVGVRELPRVGGDVPMLVEIEAVAYKDRP